MMSDSLPNASIAMASSNSKDFAKKKRANRSAKLKQCKLDARREQWLSQVKNKGDHKEEVGGREVVLRGSIGHLENERGRKIEKLDINPRREDEEMYEDGLSLHHFSDSESLTSNSPTSHTNSAMGSNDSGVNFSASCSSSSCGRSRSSSSSSTHDFCSGNMSEEDEGDGGDDECLDDWEAMADALAANDNKQSDSEFGSPSLEKNENSKEFGAQGDKGSKSFTGMDTSKTDAESGGTDKLRTPINYCAWRPDDASRPQSLPNLSKQYSFPLNSERNLGRGSIWGCNKKLGHIPKSCPICFEDLDGTDSSFLPCPCGFRLCLFCHKRIIEDDGRCPGCRKQYECDPIEGEATLDGGSLTVRLSRSCSMITRS